MQTNASTYSGKKSAHSAATILFRWSQTQATRTDHLFILTTYERIIQPYSVRDPLQTKFAVSILLPPTMPRPITNIFLGLAVSAVVGVWGVFSWYAGFEELDAIVERYPSTQIAGLDQFPDLDRGLMSMVAFNLPVVGREPAFPAGRLFMGQFLANVFAIPIILLTEGSRAAPGSLARQ